ncbi:hypothetical protein [Sphingobium lignivorans]|uniref:DUF922 domain-containing protein n=1 Tax=Sphingobium lignivorans TaxID=2735886 RepID=A0ABR6NIA7_9SPHN|nr:hypothetical protein [Sphingobium lignivorans]MBB5986996.1 hypothetical protein [Sphingobium lignivorans]
MLSLVIATAVAASAPVHQTTVEHEGVTYHVNYRQTVTTKMRTIGISPGSRPGNQRCVWSAKVQLDREIRRDQDAAPLVRRLAGDGHRVEGQVPGRCAGRRDYVETQIATSIENARDKITAMAEADRANLPGEIRAAQALAMR